MGRKDSKGVSTIREEEDETDGTTKDDGKTIGTMVEMSSVFLQLHKPDKKNKNASPRPRTPERSPRSTPGQRKAVSTIIPPTFDLGSTTELNAKGSKDDSELEIPRCLSLDSMLPFTSIQSGRGGSSPVVDSIGESQTKNDVATSFPKALETSESEQSDVADVDETTQLGPEMAEKSNRLSVSSEISCPEGDSDTGSCDISHEILTHIELVEALDGFCKQPVDDSKHFKRMSRDEGFPDLPPPKRSPPPVPSNVSQSTNIDSPRFKSPSRSPPVPNTSRTYPRGEIQQHSVDDQQKINTFPKSTFDRKVIREDSAEKETAAELNQQMHVWSSSDDESEPEWLQSSSNRVAHPKKETPPAIVIDKVEKSSIGEDVRLALDDGDKSTESFEIEIDLRNGDCPKDDEDCSNNIYWVAEPHEVDAEMYLDKGSYVKVIEKASTGWWLVQSQEGLRGWTPSRYLSAASQVPGKHEFSEPWKEEQRKEEDNEELEEQSPHMSCQVIEDYEGDPDNQEIDLQEGEILQILHKSDNGWWCVRNEQGEMGWAPSNFLEEFEEDIEYSR